MDGNLAALTISAEDSAVAFEPDESIGAAVLAHVHDVRDRLALACVLGSGDASRRRRGRGARRTTSS